MTSQKAASIFWWGQSKDVLSGFPDNVKRNLGFSLRRLQQGEEPSDYRPLPGIGKGLFELRDQDESGWYRVVYLSRIDDVIHVVHAFEKDSLEIPKKDVKTIQQNCKRVNAYMLEEKKRAKQQK
jgi:phage-related protein